MKRRNKMEEPKTITQTIVDYLTQLTIGTDDKTFLINEVYKAHRFNTNTVSTVISRDLVKKGLVTKTNKRKGKKVVYAFDPEGMPLPKPILSKTLKKAKLKPAPKTDSYDSYVKIGKGIEGLLELKNNTIKHLREKCDVLKKQLMDSEATVQDRDRHIVEQGNKIHELSEKIRNKSGGSIKLDELQSIING
jgi:hypothetical protein